MKVMERRLRRLEERFGTRENPEEPGESELMALVRERLRRCCEARGEPYTEPPRPAWLSEAQGNLSLAEMLRLRRAALARPAGEETGP